MVLLEYKEQYVRIDHGELVSFMVQRQEYIHQKGSPGWRNSDTEMFPIIGPTAKADFKVSTPKGEAIQDQHGLLREMPYVLVENNETSASYKKVYKAGTLVPNSKYPKKSTVEMLSWPYDFVFEKRFRLGRNGLKVTFRISGTEGMPFMLGYHPAFALYSTAPAVVAKDSTITLKEVLSVGSRALHIPDCSHVELKDEGILEIITEGFGDFMLWTEEPNMVCVEPITFYPYSVSEKELHQGFQKLGKEKEVFSVTIRPLPSNKLLP